MLYDTRFIFFDVIQSPVYLHQHHALCNEDMIKHTVYIIISLFSVKQWLAIQKNILNHTKYHAWLDMLPHNLTVLTYVWY